MTWSKSHSKLVAEPGLTSSLWFGQHCLVLKLNGGLGVRLARPPAVSEQLVPSGVCQGWGWVPGLGLWSG